jgi:TP901 family phage tail tape measure protein
MARDKITIELELATKRAEREVAVLQKKIEALGKGVGRAFGGGGAAGDKTRALGTGLSKATVKADEFNKSLEASNARVIAFGASAGLIMQVDRALKGMVSSAVKVEKAMKDVAVVMDVSNRTLEKFGKGMFRVAKETAQSFDTVAEAATELARQGLGMEKTLSRTKDALILTRLTGMNAADSVKTLTAAVNSFNKEGVTSAQVINRMAKVDAAFAVSSEDLAKSISRVGSSAIDAGVNLNQLMAITTAVQQKTARGGAVIGNAFKTIFTRIQRSDVQKKLSDMGVALTKDGKLMDGITILQNLSRKFDQLTKSQQANIGESVAGVFQINILKAAMSDLVNVNSEYAKSLRIANAATNEAYTRNEQLNQTLDALANKTLANLTAAGASLGGGLFEPVIRKVLGTVNTAIDSFGKDGKMEGFGQTIGKGLMGGIANFISGPGLVMAIAVFGKLAISLAKFATTALKDVMGINNATKQRLALEEAVVGLLRSEPAYLDAVEKGTLDVLKVEESIFTQIRANNLERSKVAAYAAPISKALVGRGARVGNKGTVVTKGGYSVPGGAGGFIPNFASPGGERAAAAAGGYRAGSIRTMNQPGVGSVMYNSAETVKQFPGMSQSAIMPPESSPAGAGYKSAFGATHGFDPYAGGGFIPNFRLGRPPRAEAHKFKRGKEEVYEKGKRGDVVNMDLTLPSKNRDMGIITEQGSDTTPIKFSQNIMSPKSGITELASGMKSWRGNDGRRVGSAMLRVSGIPVVPVFPISKENMSLTGGSGKKPTQPGKYLQKTLNRYSERLSKEMFGTTDIQRDFDVEGLSRGTMGDIFEEGVRVAVGGAKNDDRLAAFDYNGKKFASTRLIGFFNRQGRSANLNAKTKIEAKIGAEAAESGNIPRKMINDPDVGYNKKDVMKLFQDEFRAVTGSKGAHLKGTKTKALGFIPNFSALTDAVGREVQAGVPASAIRVGSSPALRGAGNPGGVGVYNTIHEPGGLSQGISRSKSMGINPRGHGAAGGFVPNFVEPWNKNFSKEIAEANKLNYDAKGAKAWRDSGKTSAEAAKGMKGSADKMMMAGIMLNMAASGIATGVGAGEKTTAQVSAGANVVSMGLMGASMGGPWGAAAGAGLGALTSLGDLNTAFGFRDAEIAAEEMKKISAELQEGFTVLKNSFAVLEDFDAKTPLERIKALADIVKTIEEIEKPNKNDTKVTKNLRSSLREELNLNDILQGDLSKLPKGSLANLEKEVAQAKMEIMASTGRGELGDVLNAMSADEVIVRSLDLTPEEISERKRKGFTSFQGGTYSPRVQGSLLGVKPLTGEYLGKEVELPGTGGVDTLKQIREETLKQAKKLELVRGAAALPVGERTMSTGMENQNKFDIATESVLTGKRLSGLLGRADLKDLQAELDEAIKTSEKILETADGGERRPAYQDRTLALTDFLANLQNDPRFPAFRNPEEMAAGKPSAAGAAGGMTQGELERQFRDAREGLLGESLDSRYGAARKIGRRKRYFAGKAADRANVGRMAGITMGGDSLITEQGRLKKETIDDKASQDRRETVLKQEDKLNQEELKLQETLIKDIKAITMPIEMQSKLLEEIVPRYKNISDEQIGVELKKLDDANKSMKASGESDEKLNNQQLAEIKYLEGLKKRRATIDKETDHLTGEINKSRESEKVNIDKGTAARIKERRAMLSFQKDVRINQIRDKAFQTGEEARGLRVLRDKGFGITEREIADADKASRRAGIREGTRGRASFGEVFGETNAYGKTDHMLEFEDGMTSVAENMKSSFADAFKSISSGASSGREALKAFADSILNSISDISAKMATNMLFSSMGGKAQGGYIPRFQSGGVVTGGSGFKDDVPALMSGGEYVIKKSSAQKIGYGTLNAINGGGNSGGGSIPHFQYGGFNTTSSGAPRGGGSTAGAGGGSGGFSGMDMAKMYGVSAAASMASGYLNRPDKTEKQVSRNYGLGRDEYGYFGGNDPDSGGSDAISAGGRRASVSLNKAFAYYRRDPVTGQLISERARPSEGRFETSSLLSTRGLLREDDPQTARMFSKEGKMAEYQQTRFEWKKNKEDTLKAHYDAQNARTIGAWVNAAMIVGVGKYTDPGAFGGGGGGGGGAPAAGGDMGKAWKGVPLESASGGSIPKFAEGGSVSPAMLMGGEYVMSPEAVRTHGVNFMSELNRGNVPGGAGGGFFSGGGGGGAAMSGSAPTTNNVKININIDKSGKSEVGASTETFADGGKDERDTNNEAQDNKAMAELLQGVVLSEITKQQRPGGLLQNVRP